VIYVLHLYLAIALVYLYSFAIQIRFPNHSMNHSAFIITTPQRVNVEFQFIQMWSLGEWISVVDNGIKDLFFFNSSD
jgi:hypothetical protein